MPEIDVTAMTFGPYAIARLDGQTIMVPSAVPGDRVEIRIASRRRDYSIATIERVIAPGPGRRLPPCPFLPRCGGCDWQQLEYPDQLRAKAELMVARLRRVVDLELDPFDLIEPAPAEFGYRSRIRLKVGSEGRLGFHQLGTTELVEIDRCMVAAPEILLPHEFAKSMGRNLEEIEIVKSGEREVITAFMRKPPSAAEVECGRRLVRQDHAIQGIVLRSGRVRETIGDPAVAITVEDGLEMRVDADLFSQVNRAQNRKLVATVMEMVAIEPGMELLDVFCGAGNLSLPAARRGAKVTGVDSDDLAIAMAAKNAEALGLRQTKFIAARAVDAAHFLIRARYRPQVAILDPPRIGAADLMDPIVKMMPHAVIYVSCDVSTLVRDLRILCSGGYRAKRICAFDFFPNTHHTEIAAHLLLT